MISNYEFSSTLSWIASIKLDHINARLASSTTSYNMAHSFFTPDARMLAKRYFDADNSMGT